MLGANVDFLPDTDSDHIHDYVYALIEVHSVDSKMHEIVVRHPYITVTFAGARYRCCTSVY